MRLFHHYLSLLWFAGGLLLGVQMPNWIHQYVQRVDAHYLEAKQAIAPYQLLADELFDGSMSKLIAAHKDSHTALFQREAQPLNQQYQRFIYLQSLHQQLQQGWIRRLQHLLLHLDRQIVNETMLAYQPTVPLTSTAIIAGLAGGLLASGAMEIFLWLLSLPWRKRRHGVASH